MTQTKNNRQTEMFYWLKIVLVLAIQILFRFLPNFGQVTDLGMSILGIFLGAIVGWCICDAAWPSITAILLLGMTDYGTISGIFSSIRPRTPTRAPSASDRSLKWSLGIARRWTFALG